MRLRMQIQHLECRLRMRQRDLECKEHLDLECARECASCGSLEHEYMEQWNMPVAYQQIHVRCT